MLTSCRCGPALGDRQEGLMSPVEPHWVEGKVVEEGCPQTATCLHGVRGGGLLWSAAREW